MIPRNVVRRLGMEVLERREVFTTNVAAAIEGGWLVVRGSGGIDAISITRAANGFVEINNIQGKTLINGQNTVRLPGFSGGVRCEMGAGSDFVVLGSGLSVRGPVSMNLGSGDDEFFLGLGGNTRVDGYVTILGEAGHDKASFSPSATYGSGLSFLGDAGNDELLLEGDLTFDGDILFDGGDGIDNFHCVGTLGKTFAHNVSVYTGNGSDDVVVNLLRARRLSIVTGSGEEGNGHFGIQVLRTQIEHGITVDSGDGFDNVIFDRVAAQFTNLVTGDGCDGVIVKNLVGASAVINTGSAGDVTGIYESTLGFLGMYLSDGMDSLYSQNNIVSGFADIDGGSDNDRSIRLGGNRFAHSNVRGFDRFV